MDKPIAEGVGALIEEAMRAANVLRMSAHPHKSPHAQPLLDAAAKAEESLTASQQPIREGGGEVACRWPSCECSNGTAECPKRRTAPPSAPVGVDAPPEDCTATEWLDFCNGNSTEAVAQALAQQPAAVDEAARNKLWCKKASELLPPWQWNMVNDAVRKELRATPPGDDTAGGG